MENAITKYEPRVSVCLFDLTKWFLRRAAFRRRFLAPGFSRWEKGQSHSIP